VPNALPWQKDDEAIACEILMAQAVLWKSLLDVDGLQKKMIQWIVVMSEHNGRCSARLHCP